MEDLNRPVFVRLFKAACEKCFGIPLSLPLSEADSKNLSNKIFEQTGLVIGAKSIKNYSFYVLGQNKEVKQENPSYATLDTLARYVLDAPYTDEIRRKDNEGHYPYWFQYRSQFSAVQPKRFGVRINWKKTGVVLLVTAGLIIGFVWVVYLMHRDRTECFVDNFNAVSEDSLIRKGWMIQSKDVSWWNKRNVRDGHLALYTLRGDNWPLGRNMAGIKDLLMRKIHSDCFSVEVHLSDFVPAANWQQAGILLSEDSAFDGKMLRLSMSYNDFFGGYKRPPEIIIQMVSSSESGSRSKPEIMHMPIYSREPDKDSIIKANLKWSALKIEKSSKHFRFLYTTSPVESFAFQEAFAKDLNFNPRYVGIFAIQGWADTSHIVPAYFDSFMLSGNRCE